MNRVKRAILMVGLVVAASFAALRVVVITHADRWVEEAPERSVAWAPGHRDALLALAERQLATGQYDRASATARQLLAAEPLEGRGFRVLAQAAQRSGDASRALALYKIAVKRSPRDIASRAWLVQHDLTRGDFHAALEQIDLILRLQPSQGTTLLPILAQLARDPRFAAELGRSLRRRPVWRAGLLRTLQKSGDAQTSDRVLAALQREGGLSRAELDDWIDQLIGAGRWGQAYSLWAGNLDARTRDAGLPPVFNGGFAQVPTGSGFDWRITRVPGVTLEFVPERGATGLVAHASFRDRPVPAVNLEQPLLLAAGSYRLDVRMRGESLDSDRGLEWAVTCAGNGDAVALSDRVQGTFGWRDVGADVTIPASGCDGQWLRLRNPVPKGAAQIVSGDLWFDDVVIRRVSVPQIPIQ